MEKKDINTRTDIYVLVTTFYTKVRKNDLLGPIFNKAINDWDKHFEHLTTFWESTLFITRKLENRYHGNPLKVHINVDVNEKHSISEMHFGVWLNLWIETLDQLFKGEVTENAKRRARKMSSFMYINIFQARKKKAEN